MYLAVKVPVHLGSLLARDGTNSRTRAHAFKSWPTFYRCAALGRPSRRHASPHAPQLRAALHCPRAHPTQSRHLWWLRGAVSHLCAQTTHPLVWSPVHTDHGASRRRHARPGARDRRQDGRRDDPAGQGGHRSAPRDGALHLELVARDTGGQGAHGDDHGEASGDRDDRVLQRRGVGAHAQGLHRDQV